MGRDLGWAPSNYPKRVIISLVATDGGLLNFQMSCGHVIWMWPWKHESRVEAYEIAEKWEAGERNLVVGCGGCFVGQVPPFPPGVPLPIPLTPTMYEQMLELQEIERARSGRTDEDV